jgi:suppressor of ftsI
LLRRAASAADVMRAGSGSLVRAYSLTVLVCLLAAAIPCSVTAQSRSSQTPALGPVLPPIPDAFSPVTLRAVNDPRTGLAAFSFKGREIPPVLHGRPGSVLQVDYVNAMSTHSTEMCVDGRCTNMTNLHFHGLHVSPNAPQDDVISMMASPGESLHYEVQIPRDQPPGLYWYHTHPHGESYQQSLDGMSGALIVDGIERYAPEVRSMRQQILVLRDAVLRPDDAASVAERTRAEATNAACRSESEELKRLFTVNGILRPAVAIRPGEKQFWRIVNASPDLYADLQVTGESMSVIALDGMPLSFHDPGRHVEAMTHVLLPPAGRLEAIVTGPPRGTRATLSSQCVSTGPDGDPNPAMVLADLTDALGAGQTPRLQTVPGSPVYRPIPSSKLAALQQSRPDFSVIFTEDKHGFYINDKKYESNASPMITVPVGAYHHWSVVNRSHEVHPFHIHQVHFQMYAKDGVALHPAEWFDTVNVEPGSTVDMIMDFTDPIIRGVSVFHCHLLQHEDKGMMAKILFIDPTPAH